jgi:addiction module HigA family antidote
MKMHAPTHPGFIIRDDVLPELQLSVTEAARQLTVSRVALSRVINGRARISAEMAIRLAQWLGGEAETWLRLQMQYDLWHAEQASHIRITPARCVATQP